MVLSLCLLILLSMEATTGNQGYFQPEAENFTEYSPDWQSEDFSEPHQGHKQESFYESETSRRQGRSFPQSPMVDILMQSMAPNYSPNNPGDLFDIIRDSYPLPNGQVKSQSSPSHTFSKDVDFTEEFQWNFGLTAPRKEYDYVIVGAGSAGCVLASRLSENPNITVLLIEAGRPEMALTDVPSVAPYFQLTDYAWQYFMEPQPGVCLGMINGRCFWPRGRAVGGTSVINYMIYTRGRAQEWDRIAAAGNYGWSYKEVLEYYKKSERANLYGLEYSPYRGRSGEMNVEHVNFRTPLIEAFLEAGRILGTPTVDYNNPETLGFGYVQTTTRSGRRMSAARAFLYDNRLRPNLHILPMTRVTKVLIHSKTQTAYGVEYVRNRLKHKVKARREVILSAGPIASPQLLMLSGVGPREQLGRHGISVIKDLPVGRTLYDHITFPALIFTLTAKNVSINENRVATLENVIRYFRYGDNAVSSPGGVEGIGYIKTPISDDGEGIPDIEFISIGGSLLSDGGPTGSKAVRRGMMLSNKMFNSIFGPIDNTDTWSAFPMLLHPKSVGSIELKDNNPFSFPRMYGNYLTHPKDAATFIASIRYLQALAATKPFQRYGARIYRAQYPTCKDWEFDTDQFWECAVRTFTATLHHQIATCRMGPKGDPLAIVDPELRVHGIRKLRVVDSSIIPRTISAHTHAPAVMIGEKAADMIKSTWR